MAANSAATGNIKAGTPGAGYYVLVNDAPVRLDHQHRHDLDAAHEVAKLRGWLRTRA